MKMKMKSKRFKLPRSPVTQVVGIVRKMEEL